MVPILWDHPPFGISLCPWVHSEVITPSAVEGAMVQELGTSCIPSSKQPVVLLILNLIPMRS